jgi:uncharacterized protein
MTANRTVVVVAKTPLPGLVKTRLCPPLSPEQAATLAAAALRDTFHAVRAVPDIRRVLTLDGEPGDWVPRDFDVVAQPPGTLDERLAAAFAETTGPTVLIGMDTPQVQPTDLELALAILERGTDAVVGPASDGGYWLHGLRVSEMHQHHPPPQRSDQVSTPSIRPSSAASASRADRRIGAQSQTFPCSIRPAICTPRPGVQGQAA